MESEGSFISGQIIKSPETADPWRRLRPVEISLAFELVKLFFSYPSLSAMSYFSPGINRTPATAPFKNPRNEFRDFLLV